MRGMSFIGGLGRFGIGALAAISRNFMLPSFALFGTQRPTSPDFGRGGRGRRHSGVHPANNTGWWRARADISPIAITEKMLLRHGWYRRNLRNEAALRKEAAHAEL